MSEEANQGIQGEKAVQQQFNGLVLGGPHDGQYLSWRAPYYEVAMWEGPAPCYEDTPTTKVATAISYDAFAYYHMTFYDREFWAPVAVQSGGMYDNVHYNDPTEFILKKLMAGYRPEAQVR